MERRRACLVPHILQSFQAIAVGLQREREGMQSSGCVRHSYPTEDGPSQQNIISNAFNKLHQPRAALQPRTCTWNLAGPWPPHVSATAHWSVSKASQVCFSQFQNESIWRAHKSISLMGQAGPGRNSSIPLIWSSLLSFSKAFLKTVLALGVSLVHVGAHFNFLLGAASPDQIRKSAEGVEFRAWVPSTSN